MKLASFCLDHRPTYGLVRGDELYPVDAAYSARYPTLKKVLEAGDLVGLEAACMGTAVGMSAVTWLPPLPDPDKILCVGMNYKKPYPVAGVQLSTPEHPIFFARHADSFVGHEAALHQPMGSAGQSYDFEAEVVAVIGKAGRHIAVADALAHVLGYALMNEGSVRGWMTHSVHAGKNFFASGAWGPWMTVGDLSPENLELSSLVNGVQMQTAGLSEMIFDLPTLISYISQITPLAPGDLIATGSPDGTGGSRTPPVFLRPGDQVEITSPSLGHLSNPVVAG